MTAKRRDADDLGDVFDGKPVLSEPEAKDAPKKRTTNGKQKFDEERRAVFLRMVSERGLIQLAADAAGVSRKTVYSLRETDPEFAAQWEAALERHFDRCEAEAYRRAVEGYDEPVYWQGEECGVVRRYSDSLLSQRLKAKRPREYRDNVSVDAKVDATVRSGVLLVPDDEK